MKQGSSQVLYLAVEKRVYFSMASLQPEVTAYPQFLDACRLLSMNFGCEQIVVPSYGCCQPAVCRVTPMPMAAQ